MEIMKHVANRIRELRQAAGMSQEDIANALGIATNTVSRWETSTYKPSIDDLEKLARHLKTSVLEFFPRTEEENKSVKLAALLRAAEHLEEGDIDELQRYAEFRRARSLYNKPKPTGRKKKDAA